MAWQFIEYQNPSGSIHNIECISLYLKSTDVVFDTTLRLKVYERTDESSHPTSNSASLNFPDEPSSTSEVVIVASTEAIGETATEVRFTNFSVPLTTEKSYYVVLVVETGSASVVLSERDDDSPGGAGNNAVSLNHSIKTFSDCIVESSLVNTTVNHHPQDLKGDSISINPDLANVFYAQVIVSGNIDPNNHGGHQNSEDKFVITQEARNLTLPDNVDNLLLSDLILDKYLTVVASDNTDTDSSFTQYLETNNNSDTVLEELVGETVNVYLVYLNTNVSRRDTSDAGEITFETDILAVGLDYTHTLYFVDSLFPYNNYPSENDDNRPLEYPGKFNDRGPEFPAQEEGSDKTIFANSWTDPESGKDWFKISGDRRIITLGCDNGDKGDFVRIITRSCSN